MLVVLFNLCILCLEDFRRDSVLTAAKDVNNSIKTKLEIFRELKKTSLLQKQQHSEEMGK
jgi:hypothetical protein